MKIETIIKISEHQPTMICSAEVTASLKPVVLYATVSVDPVDIRTFACDKNHGIINIYRLT